MIKEISENLRRLTYLLNDKYLVTSGKNALLWKYLTYYESFVILSVQEKEF